MSKISVYDDLETTDFMAVIPHTEFRDLPTSLRFRYGDLAIETGYAEFEAVDEDLHQKALNLDDEQIREIALNNLPTLTVTCQFTDDQLNDLRGLAESWMPEKPDNDDDIYFGIDQTDDAEFIVTNCELQMIVTADGSGTWLVAHISNPDTIDVQLVDKEADA